MPNQVPDEVKSRRISELIRLQQEITGQILDDCVGKTYTVLAEGPSSREPDWLMGRTPEGFAVNFPAAGRKIGDLIQVLITRNAVHTLIGETV